MGLALSLSACGGGSTGTSGAKENKSLTVWLMDGSVPDSVVKSVNADLAKEHPGATVNVQVQQWNGIQDKLTTALAGNNPPDVIEMGNTQTAKFSASGALLDLGPSKQKLGADQWSQGMASSGVWNGKT
jgi:N,N'-diacetylchitobiose transport system substrate-binding protein